MILTGDIRDLGQVDHPLDNVHPAHFEEARLLLLVGLQLLLGVQRARRCANITR